MKKEMNSVIVPFSAETIYRPSVRLGDVSLRIVEHVIYDAEDFKGYMHLFSSQCIESPKEGVICLPIWPGCDPNHHYTQRIWANNVPLIVTFRFKAEDECVVEPLRIEMEVKKFLFEEGDEGHSEFVGLIGVDMYDGTPMLYRFTPFKGDTDDVVYNYNEEEWVRTHYDEEDFSAPDII